MLPELDLEVGGQPANVRDAPPQDVAPRRGKRLAAKLSAPMLDEDGFAEQPGDDEQGETGNDEELQSLALCRAFDRPLAGCVAGSFQWRNRPLVGTGRRSRRPARPAHRNEMTGQLRACASRASASSGLTTTGCVTFSISGTSLCESP